MVVTVNYWAGGQPKLYYTLLLIVFSLAFGKFWVEPRPLLAAALLTPLVAQEKSGTTLGAEIAGTPGFCYKIMVVKWYGYLKCWVA